MRDKEVRFANRQVGHPRQCRPRRRLPKAPRPTRRGRALRATPAGALVEWSSPAAQTAPALTRCRVRRTIATQVRAYQWCDADLDVVPLTGGQLFDAALGGRSLESD